MTVPGLATPVSTTDDKLNTLATEPGSNGSTAARLADVTATMPSSPRLTLAIA